MQRFHLITICLFLSLFPQGISATQPNASDSLETPPKPKVWECFYTGPITDEDSNRINAASTDAGGNISNPLLPQVAIVDKTKDVGAEIP